MKKSVLESLANPDRKVRRVFATQLLSMGINCQIFVASITGVYQDHWSSTSKKLEGGGGGRDGSPSQVVLLFCDSQLKT